MPSKTFRQARMLAGAAHDPVFARKVGVRRDVAKEYNKADDRSGFLSSAMRTKMQKGGRVRKPQPGDNESMIGGMSPELLEETRPRDPNSAKDAYEQQWDKFRAPKRVFRGDTDIPNNRPVTKAKGGSVRGVGAAKRGFRPAKFY